MGRPPKNKYQGVRGLRLNIGCGNKRTEGAVNIDRQGSDLDLDLEDACFPFDDGSVDYVQSDHCLEHIRNLIPLINEIHRVMAPNAEARIRVPVLPNLEAFQDPTHVRFFTDRTFNYWLSGDFLFEEVGKGYGIKPFSRMIQRAEGFELVVRMWK